jgi:uncharacterized protein
VRWLTSFCAQHPRATLAVIIVVSLTAGWSIRQVDRAVGTDATLGADHPAVRQLRDFLDRFGGGYPVLVAYECARPSVCGSVLDPAALRMTASVAQQVAKSPFVARVSSPATSTLLLSDPEVGIAARRLVVDGLVTTDVELLNKALSDPLWSGVLLSADGRVGAIIVEMSSTQTDALLSVVDDIRTAIRPFEGDQFRFFLVGEAVMWVAAHEDAASSALRVGIGTGGMLLLTLLFLIRSLSAVLASLATIGVASMWTIGTLPLFGWQLSELTNGAATLILVIGCADCVHLVAHYLESRSRFANDADALVATSEVVLAPCFVTTATSAGSFLAFASGGVYSLTQFGVLAAIGVSVAFFLTFSLLPALLVLAPPRFRAPRHSQAWQEVLSRVAAFGTRRHTLVIAVSAALAVIGVLGLTKLRVELGLHDLWGPEHEISRSLLVVSENLQRPDRLEVELALPPGQDIEDPAVLETVETVEWRLRGLNAVGRCQSIATMLRYAHDRLHRSKAQPSIPSAATTGELLLLLSSGDSRSVDPWMTLDQSHLRISMEVEKLNLPDKSRLIESVRSILDETVPDNWKAGLTGTVVLAYRHGSEFAQSQISIVSVSSLVVVALVGVYLRSVAWALLAAVPNAVALLLLFGAMGHWGIELNFGSAIVAPIAIGIAADDTIHFLTAYARRRRAGVAPVAALEQAISGVGEAVVATAIALGLGFLSMTTSPFPSISNIGLFGAMAIAGATIADLVILPALISAVAAFWPFGEPPGGRS